MKTHYAVGRKTACGRDAGKVSLAEVYDVTCAGCQRSIDACMDRVVPIWKMGFRP